MLLSEKQAGTRWKAEPRGTVCRERGQVGRRHPPLRGRALGPGLVIGLVWSEGDNYNPALIRDLDGLCKDVVLLVMDAN